MAQKPLRILRRPPPDEPHEENTMNIQPVGKPSKRGGGGRGRGRGQVQGQPPRIYHHYPNNVYYNNNNIQMANGPWFRNAGGTNGYNSIINNNQIQGAPLVQHQYPYQYQYQPQQVPQPNNHNNTKVITTKGGVGGRGGGRGVHHPNASAKIADKVQTVLRTYLQNLAPPASATVDYVWAKLTKPEEWTVLCDTVGRFMRQLDRRMNAHPQMSYLELNDKRNEDLTFYADRLQVLILSCQACPPFRPIGYSADLVLKYDRIIDRYLRLHPPNILHFRSQLIGIRAQMQAINAQAGSSSVKLTKEMVTFREVTHMRLFKILSGLPDARQQLDYFLKEISLSKQAKHSLNQFVSILESALLSEPFTQLGIRVLSFGSLRSGLGTYDSDLDIVLHFCSHQLDSARDKLDYETSMLILRLVRTILPKRLGFSPTSHGHHGSGRAPGSEVMDPIALVPSKRCPILKFNFELCCRHLTAEVRANNQDPHRRPISFNRCDLSVSSVYGVYNSAVLEFLTRFEPRFYEMTMLLKYWAKKNALINTEAFSSYGVAMLVLFFLQTRSPPIMPSIELLQELAAAEGKPPLVIHGFHFEFSDNIAAIREAMDIDGTGPNPSTTEQLLVRFFEYYHEFDYERNAICPRLGRVVTKHQLYQEKEALGLGGAFKHSTLVLEDPFVLEHNPGSSFHDHYMPKWKATLARAVSGEWHLSPENCVLVLTNPDLWDPTPPPRQLNRAADSKGLWAMFKALRKEFAGEKKQAKLISKGRVLNQPLPSTSTAAATLPITPTPILPDIEPKMVTCKRIDAKKIHSTLSAASGDSATRLDAFLGLILLPDDYLASQQRFIDLLNQAIRSCSSLSPLKLRIDQIGSQPAGLATLGSDLNLVVTSEADANFAAYDHNYDNAEPAKNVIRMVQSVLQARLHLPRKMLSVTRDKRSYTCPARRRPVWQITSLEGCLPKRMNSGSNTGQFSYRGLDLSVGLPYGLHQARLLKLFADFEPRFAPLLHVLKYWAERNGLVDRDLNRQEDLLSPYALTILLVYYLQCQSPPVLPSVVQLRLLAQYVVPPPKPVQIGRYELNNLCTDAGFVRSKFSSPPNDSSISDLIRGFFRFYQGFNYAERAVLPMVGAEGLQLSLQEMLQAKEQQLGRGLTRSFTTTSLVIEDPLVPDWNLGLKRLGPWLSFVERSCQLLGKNPTKDDPILLLTDPANFAPPTEQKSAAGATSKTAKIQLVKTSTTTSSDTIRVANNSTIASSKQLPQTSTTSKLEKGLTSLYLSSDDSDSEDEDNDNDEEEEESNDDEGDDYAEDDSDSSELLQHPKESSKEFYLSSAEDEDQNKDAF